MKPVIFIFLQLLPLISLCQADTLLQVPEQDDLIESFFQEQEEDGDFDYNDVFEELERFHAKPISVNGISAETLNLFPFLTPIQINAFIDYQQVHGPLISIYELQAIPHFDLLTIEKLLPFVQKEMSSTASFSSIIEGDLSNQLIIRASRTLQKKRGFSKGDSEQPNYEGDRNSIYVRYRGTISNKISFGFTAEKDEGESFFTKSNKQGFDFFSAHLFYNNTNEKLRTIALGDYSVSMGQGLIQFNGFATRKGPTSLGIKRTTKTLRRYGSVNESDYFRGGAISYAPLKNVEVTAFYSNKRRDANLGEDIIDETDPEFAFVTSLQTSGKHRTAAEINDENSIRQTTIGGVIKWNNRKTRLAVNGLYNSLNKPLSRNPALYNQFYFNGDKLANASIDYSHSWRNLHAFGETAFDDAGGFATTNGLIASLDPKMDVALLHRNFQKDYVALNAKPFSETSGGRNEKGTYLGLEIRPHYRWIVNAYFDFWKHDWLRFRTDSPSNGQEWLVRLTYRERKKMEIHVQLKNETKFENEDSPDGRYDQILERRNVQGRVHLSYKLNKNLEWRTRFYAGFTEKGIEKLEGVAIFQDLKYRSLGVPITFSARYAIFNTDDYAIRFYAYENDVLNSFTVPAYYGRGSRFYILTSYKIRRGLTFEGRIARTYYSDRETIGSSNDEINGPIKTDVKMQLRWNF